MAEFLGDLKAQWNQLRMLKLMNQSFALHEEGQALNEQGQGDRAGQLLYRSAELGATAQTLAPAAFEGIKLGISSGTIPPLGTENWKSFVRAQRRLFWRTAVGRGRPRKPQPR